MRKSVRTAVQGEWWDLRESGWGGADEGPHTSYAARPLGGADGQEINLVCHHTIDYYSRLAHDTWSVADAWDVRFLTAADAILSAGEGRA